MAQRLKEPWSGKTPVPTVSLKGILDPRGATEAKARKLRGSSAEDDEQKATQKAAGRLAKGEELTVRDPVTGEEMTIRDATDEPTNETKGDNVLSRDFPPPDWNAYYLLAIANTQRSLFEICALYIVIPLVFELLPIPFTNSQHASTRLVVSLFPPSLLSYFILFRLRRKLRDDYDDRVWHAERVRGMMAGEKSVPDVDGNDETTHESGQERDEERVKESAEWLNALVKGVWPIINSDMFISMTDMLEDIMQSSLPKFIHSVRIADLGQGNNAMRITSLRSLPDADVDDALQGLEDGERDSLTGEHINMEMAFSYRAEPSGASAHSKGHNAHLLIEFSLGAQGVYEIKVPVWVELRGMAGTSRVRLQLISDPPFIKTSLITLVGLPSLDISVVPMSKHLPDVMNLPVVSTFIHSAIREACAQYVAPKSLILDMQRLISGDDIKKDTDAIGVLLIHIHRATNLTKMDSTGSSATDPYVTVVYSRLAKPMFSTRIIEKDLNPVFEEFTAVLVDANTLKVGEKLCLQLWDSDRGSADDMLGQCDVDILELIRNKGQAFRRSTPLKSPDCRDRSGNIEYTVGYYGKLPPKPELKSDGMDPGIPEDFKDKPEFQQDRSVALNELEDAVLMTPPDPHYPSGILSVQVHEIRELMVRVEGRDEKTTGENEEGQDQSADEQEEAKGQPSSYCNIELNDEVVYATRVKPISSSPTFNAGTERFIQDWRTAHVSVVVRDSRLRENDPILGIVFLKLSDLFKNSSQNTRFHSLEHGIGHGRVRISVLFRPVAAKLPSHLLGFSTGTVSVRNLRVKPDSEEVAHTLSHCDVRLKTASSSTKVSRQRSTDDGVITWQMDGEGGVELPVRKRYASPLLLTFKSRGSLPVIAGNTRALAALWLRDLVDNEDKTVEIALWQTKDWARLKHNYVSSSGDLAAWRDAEHMHRIGTVELDLTFMPGITAAHKEILDTSNPAKQQIWDEFDRRTDAGLDDLVGELGEQENGAPDSKQNTEVDPSQTKVEALAHKKVHQKDHHHPTDDGDLSNSDTHENEERSDSESETGSDNAGGPISKFKHWQREQHQLYRDHRGIMQKKPARTAMWMKDEIAKGGHKIKDRFAMKERQPDVETEV